MLKYDHFIFDFDGTLSDSYPYFAKAAKAVVDQYGICVSDEEMYQLLKWKTAGYFFDTLNLGDRRDEAMQLFNSIKRGLLRSDATAIDGAKELLEKICSAGGKCYIYSHSGEIVIDNSKKWGLDVYLTDYFLGSHKYPRKPAPDALLALVAKHGLDVSRCVMIGDRDIDILAGKNAGMDGILIDDSCHYQDLDVTYCVRDLAHIADVIFE